ncbi:MAG: TolC family protein [Melioribacteraceae bacterium]
MKKITTICLLLCSVTLFAQTTKISLGEAVSLAIQNNERIKQYQEKVVQKEYDNLSAYSNFLPSLNFDLSYTHLNDVMVIDLSPIRDVIITLQSTNQAELTNLGSIVGGKGPLSQAQKDGIKIQVASSLNSLIPAFKETFKKQNYRTGTFIVTQPLFLGGKLLAAKGAASAEMESANIELEKTKNEIVYEVIDRYTKVLLLNSVVETRKDVLNGILSHKEKAEKLFNEGLIANHHLLRAEVAVAEAERNLENDKNNLVLATTALRNTIGINESESISFTDSLVFKNSTDSLSSLKAKAKLDQPILRIIEQKKLLAEENFNVTRSAFLPTIAAFGKYEIYPEYLSSLEPRWAIGVQMKYNIFNGFKDYLKLQTAKHLEKEVEFAEADAQKKIELWVIKSYLEVENNKTRFLKLDATINLANENLRQNEKRFETGMGTSLEVIDARLQLEKIQIERELSLYNYYNALSDLYLATGNPTELLNIWVK